MDTTDLDISQFRWIPSQTIDEDRRALLSIREALCRAVGGYDYLEVGSHLGGSLQPHVADKRCRSIFSIDPRPADQPDERWTTNYRYEGNSTERMFEHLAQVPDADLSKIRTFEASSWDLQAGDIPPCVNYAFIDGEHTNAAVLRDFESVRRFLAEPSVLAFHDSYVTAVAILKIRKVLGAAHSNACFLHYPNSLVIAIVFDSTGKLAAALEDFGWQKKLPISDWYNLKVRISKTPVYPLLKKCKSLLLRS